MVWDAHHRLLDTLSSLSPWLIVGLFVIAALPYLNTPTSWVSKPELRKAHPIGLGSSSHTDLSLRPRPVQGAAWLFDCRRPLGHAALPPAWRPRPPLILILQACIPMFSPTLLVGMWNGAAAHRQPFGGSSVSETYDPAIPSPEYITKGSKTGVQKKKTNLYVNIHSSTFHNNMD